MGLGRRSACPWTKSCWPSAQGLTLSHLITQRGEKTSAGGLRFNKMSNCTASSKSWLTVTITGSFTPGSVWQCQRGGWWHAGGRRLPAHWRAGGFVPTFAVAPTVRRSPQPQRRYENSLDFPDPERVSGTAQGSMEHSVRSAKLGYPREPPDHWLSGPETPRGTALPHCSLLGLFLIFNDASHGGGRVACLLSCFLSAPLG